MRDDCHMLVGFGSDKILDQIWEPEFQIRDYYWQSSIELDVFSVPLVSSITSVLYTTAQYTMSTLFGVSLPRTLHMPDLIRTKVACPHSKVRQEHSSQLSKESYEGTSGFVIHIGTGIHDDDFPHTAPTFWPTNSLLKTSI